MAIRQSSATVLLRVPATISCCVVGATLHPAALSASSAHLALCRFCKIDPAGRRNLLMREAEASVTVTPTIFSPSFSSSASSVPGVSSLALLFAMSTLAKRARRTPSRRSVPMSETRHSTSSSGDCVTSQTRPNSFLQRLAKSPSAAKSSRDSVLSSSRVDLIPESARKSAGEPGSNSARLAASLKATKAIQARTV